MAGVNLSPELQEKINDIKKSQARIETILQQSKDGVKEQLVTSIISVMNSEDFEHNKEYVEFKNNYRGRARTDAVIQKEWLKSLSKDKQINLLAEYSIDAEHEKGSNDWEAKLKEAQDAKEVSKKGLAVSARAVIASYNALMKEHNGVIAELKKDIKEAEKDIQAKTKELADIQSKMKKGEKIDPAAVKVIQDEANRLTQNKTNLVNKLDILEKQTSVYKEAIDAAISEIEEKLKNKGIYIGVYEGLGKSTPDQSSNTQSQTVGGAVQTAPDNRKPSEIGKAMMVDFDNLAPSEIVEMIEHTGYGDLLEMSRNLGPINRLKLKTAIENRLDDKKDGIKIPNVDPTKPNVDLSLEDLKNLRNIDDEKFNSIVAQINSYTDNYENMKVYERQEAEKIMEYLKMAVLLAESHTNKIGRFMRKLSHAGKRIEDIGAELNRFSRKKGVREDKKWSKNQTLREMLKVKTPIPSTERKKHIDRSGTKPIQRGGR